MCVDLPQNPTKQLCNEVTSIDVVIQSVKCVNIDHHSETNQLFISNICGLKYLEMRGEKKGIKGKNPNDR